jgi:hypothetical protein
MGDMLSALLVQPKAVIGILAASAFTCWCLAPRKKPLPYVSEMSPKAQVIASKAPFRFGEAGGSAPENVSEIMSQMKDSDCGVELLVSFGRSNSASAGHLAVCLRQGKTETVYSANFYADGSHDPEHHYTGCLPCLLLRCH